MTWIKILSTIHWVSPFCIMSRVVKDLETGNILFPKTQLDSERSQKTLDGLKISPFLRYYSSISLYDLSTYIIEEIFCIKYIDGNLFLIGLENSRHIIPRCVEEIKQKYWKNGLQLWSSCKQWWLLDRPIGNKILARGMFLFDSLVEIVYNHEYCIIENS